MHQLGSFALLDFETTRSPTGLRMVEVGLLVIEGGEVVDSFQTLANPGCRIDPFSFRCHGISNRDVAGAGSFLDHWPELVSRMSGRPVAAHNATFDVGVLAGELRRHGLPLLPVREWWCTLKMARRVWPGERSHALGNLARSLHLQGINSHRAMDDIMLTLELMRRGILEANDRGMTELEHLRPILAISPRAWKPIIP